MTTTHTSASGPVTVLEFELSHQVADAVQIIARGEIDMVTAPELGRVIDRVIADDQPRLVEVNLAGVAFMDSSGVNTLVRCRRVADRHGCRIVVSQPQPAVYRVLDITGVLDAFGIAR